MLIASLCVLTGYHNRIHKLKTDIKELKTKLGQSNQRLAEVTQNLSERYTYSNRSVNDEEKVEIPKPKITTKAQTLVNINKGVEKLVSELGEIIKAKSLFVQQTGGEDEYLEAIVQQIDTYLDLPEATKRDFAECIKDFYKGREAIRKESSRVRSQIWAMAKGKGRQAYKKVYDAHRAIFDQLDYKQKQLIKMTKIKLGSYLQSLPKDKKILGNRIIDWLINEKTYF
jgi:uncharacterized coiled-coil DUF342 family protein